MNQNKPEMHIFPIQDELSTEMYLCYLEAFSGRPIALERFRQIYFDHLAYDSRYSFVYKSDHKILAFLLAKRLPGNSLYITICGVRRGYQRQGLMGQLVEEMEKSARMNAVSSIFLDILHDNIPAINAFNKWGYLKKTQVFTFRFGGKLYDTDLFLEESYSQQRPELNSFDMTYIDRFTMFDVKIYGEEIVGSVILDMVRKQIVHIELHQEYRGNGLVRKVINKVVKDTGCCYVFRVGNEEIKSFLLKVGFESILEQIVLRKT